MATYKNKNFSGRHSVNLKVGNGDTFINCNFSQQLPDTNPFGEATGLTFENCNLLNCSLPKDAKTKGCLMIKKSYCAHLHPDKKLLKCGIDCEHSRIDGELTVYEDKLIKEKADGDLLR